MRKELTWSSSRHFQFLLRVNDEEEKEVSRKLKITSKKALSKHKHHIESTETQTFDYTEFELH